MRLYNNHPLKELNSFGIPVHAAQYAKISSADDLQRCIPGSREEKRMLLILGGGSNILFTRDVEGLVLHMAIRGKKVVDRTEEKIYLEVGAGEPWDGIVDYCVKQGWGGLENLSLIPGQTGSGPIQNIGAYGTELAEHFYCLDAYDMAASRITRLYKDDCRFGYRDSIFKSAAKGRYVILGVIFALDARPRVRTGYGAIEAELKDLGVTKPGISDVREAVCRIRSQKLPDPAILGNAGSFFKNPVVPVPVFELLKKEYPDMVAFPENGCMKIAAGWLIEKDGWKGYRIGDAGVHDKQALVLVNHGNATGGEILELSCMIRESVFKTFGIRLREEVHVL